MSNPANDDYMATYISMEALTLPELTYLYHDSNKNRYYISNTCGSYSRCHSDGRCLIGIPQHAE